MWLTACDTEDLFLSFKKKNPTAGVRCSLAIGAQIHKLSLRAQMLVEMAKETNKVALPTIDLNVRLPAVPAD